MLFLSDFDTKNGQNLIICLYLCTPLEEIRGKTQVIKTF